MLCRTENNLHYAIAFRVVLTCVRSVLETIIVNSIRTTIKRLSKIEAKTTSLFCLYIKLLINSRNVGELSKKK